MDKFTTKDSDFTYRLVGQGSKRYLKKAGDNMAVGGKNDSIYGDELYVSTRDGLVRVVKLKANLYVIYNNIVKNKVEGWVNTTPKINLPLADNGQPLAVSKSGFIGQRSEKIGSSFVGQRSEKVEIISSVCGDNHSEFAGSPNMPDEFSNSIGSWFKKNFTKSDEKVEFTPVEVKAEHEKSGSKKPLGEWLKSDSGKTFASALSGIALSLLPSKNPKNEENLKGGNDNSDDERESKTILGMKPITFGLVALGVVALGIGGFIYLSKKSKLVAPTA